MNNLHLFKKIIDPFSHVFLNDSNSICVKSDNGNKQLLNEKIGIISIFIQQFGNKLQLTDPKDLKRLYIQLLQQCENQTELKTIVVDLFNHVILQNTIPCTTINPKHPFLFKIAESPKNAKEFQQYLTQVLEKFPRYQFGNQLEVYDVQYDAFPETWNRSEIFANLKMQLELYAKDAKCSVDHEDLSQLTNKVKNLYKPQVFVHLAISIETSPEDSANLAMWSTCHPFIENKKPLIVNRHLLRAQGLRFKMNTNISACDVYCQKEVTLCLIIPKGQSPEELGFNSQGLELWSRPLTSMAPFREKKNRTYLHDLFLKDGDVKFVRFVSLSGHGNLSDSNSFKKGSIAGMDFLQFQNTLKVLYDNNTAMLVLTSCYAGGINSNEIHLPGKTVPFPIFIEGSFESSIKAEVLGSSNLNFLEKAQKLIFPKDINQSIPRQLQKRDCEALTKCLNSNHHLCNTPSYMLPSNNNSDIPKIVYCSNDTKLLDVNMALNTFKNKMCVEDPINLHTTLPAILFTKTIINGILCLTHPKAIFISRGGKSQHLLRKLELRNQSFEQFLEGTFNKMPVETNKAYYISEVDNIFEGKCSTYKKVLINNFQNQKEVIFKSDFQAHFYRIRYEKKDKRWIKRPDFELVNDTTAHYHLYYSTFDSRPNTKTLLQLTGGQQDHSDFFHSL